MAPAEICIVKHMFEDRRAFLQSQQDFEIG